MSSMRTDNVVRAVVLVWAVGLLVPSSACEEDGERPTLPECREKTPRAFNICFQSSYNDESIYTDKFRNAIEMTVVSSAGDGLNQKCHESCGAHNEAPSPSYSFATLRDSEGRDWGIGIYPDDAIARVHPEDEVLLYWLVDEDLPGSTCGISVEDPKGEIVPKYVRDAGGGGSTAAAHVGSPGLPLFWAERRAGGRT